MSIRVLVTCDELPEANRILSYDRQQSTTLLDLEADCRADIAVRLPVDERQKHAEDSRHFWYNGEFQSHRGRTIGHIAATPTIALSFLRDNFIVSTPRHTDMDLRMDPEVSVSEFVDWLHSKSYIGSTCCYEVINSRGIALDAARSLSEQNTLPWSDSAGKAAAHVRVRLRKPILRTAIAIMIVCAAAGLSIGWFVHHNLIH